MSLLVFDTAADVAASELLATSSLTQLHTVFLIAKPFIFTNQLSVAKATLSILFTPFVLLTRISIMERLSFTFEAEGFIALSTVVFEVCLFFSSFLRNLRI